MTLKTGSRSRGAERGAELVEFALVLPVLLFVMLGICDFGMVFQRYQIVTNAAREGARASAVGLTDDQVTAIVNEYLAAGGLTAEATIDIETVVIDGVNAKRVSVSYPYGDLFIGPLVSWFSETSPGPLTLQAVSTMRTEG